MNRADENAKSLVVDILSKSFDDNQSVNYVVKQDSLRKQRIRELMNYSFDVCNQFGEVWLSDDRNGCALILHPDRKRFSAKSILWDARLAIKSIGVSRISAVLNRESKIKAFHPAQPFSYLWFVGVEPTCQNLGIGSDLLKQIIERSKDQGRSIYLETSVERNLIWYQKHGFQIFQTLDFSYTLYMLRRNFG